MKTNNYLDAAIWLAAVEAVQITIESLCEMQKKKMVPEACTYFYTICQYFEDHQSNQNSFNNQQSQIGGQVNTQWIQQNPSSQNPTGSQQWPLQPSGSNPGGVPWSNQQGVYIPQSKGPSSGYVTGGSALNSQMDSGWSQGTQERQTGGWQVSQNNNQMNRADQTYSNAESVAQQTNRNQDSNAIGRVNNNQAWAADAPNQDSTLNQVYQGNSGVSTSNVQTVQNQRENRQYLENVSNAGSWGDIKSNSGNVQQENNNQKSQQMKSQISSHSSSFSNKKQQSSSNQKVSQTFTGQNGQQNKKKFQGLDGSYFNGQNIDSNQAWETAGLSKDSTSNQRYQESQGTVSNAGVSTSNAQNIKNQGLTMESVEAGSNVGSWGGISSNSGGNQYGSISQDGSGSNSRTITVETKTVKTIKKQPTVAYVVASQGVDAGSGYETFYSAQPGFNFQNGYLSNGQAVSGGGGRIEYLGNSGSSNMGMEGGSSFVRSGSSYPSGTVFASSNGVSSGRNPTVF